MDGIGRIRAAFDQAKAQDRCALVAYIMGCDPDPKASMPYIQALAEGGADVIEIGIPFSDPVADGPTIQKAAVRALDAGTRVTDVLDMVRSLRDDGLTTPIVTMTYANIPYTMGYAVYADRLRECGIDGTIIADMPVDECGPLRDELDPVGVANVLLSAPTTRGDRLARIARETRGFLYLVGTLGTTGARAELADETVSLLGRVAPVARDADVPLAVGFGVSRREHVNTLAQHGADGVVVGSAIVRMVEEGQTPAAVADFVRDLASGTTHTP